jgi:hypothetical protein
MSVVGPLQVSAPVGGGEAHAVGPDRPTCVDREVFSSNEVFSITSFISITTSFSLLFLFQLPPTRISPLQNLYYNILLSPFLSSTSSNEVFSITSCISITTSFSLLSFKKDLRLTVTRPTSDL